ncbi:leucine-rich repeat and WD repeat-containing protein 1-like isoform X1 [Daktulosphaira vitifoliae]|uniref:leucine-rich repeat and WD repeat-containing protein 1-like isoform X1 n=1 Tax=Daktulosphaira vitifoliae TaxID=58002 RepID=UPI0021A9BD6C|nr:leucine-rich repeat and WD repeat-containing protein 1-like isoform X1 [Daktulosphaira vitifoliae]XP_050543863.1 leucine-rich repeat and WD repeat-containing protein 1-like isoform X1 [Daktulosphaira vitifoliae]
MDFKPKHFLRCHSKTDKDSADVSTQVWQAIFEPNIDSKGSFLVATCGGNKVCVIDVRSGVVQYRYSYSKGLLYTLSWCMSCQPNKILATSGTYSSIVFIDLSSKSAYLTYDLTQRNKKIFVSSILFHPYEKKLFCALNIGNIHVLGFDVINSQVVNIEQLNIIETEKEIFGLTCCEKNNYLLISTNKSLLGVTMNKILEHSLKTIVFELPSNPNELYKNQYEKVIDSVEVISGSWIITKVALHGVMYIFNLESALSKINNDKCIIEPTYVLNWSDSDNYFMSCGVGLDGKIVACGDDKGAIWIYDLKDLNFKTNNKKEVIDPCKILRWPKPHDNYLKKKKKLEVDVYDIVVAKSAIHSSGNYLVAVTNNNFVCIYSKA